MFNTRLKQLMDKVIGSSGQASGKWRILTNISLNLGYNGKAPFKFPVSSENYYNKPWGT